MININYEKRIISKLTAEKNGYTLKQAEPEDAEAYFSQNYNPLDAEVARLTGSRTDFSHDEVVDFFRRSIASEDRYDFLILAPDGRIIGESVINEIDWELRSANYRICIFHPEDCSKGIGFWAVEQTRDFAFEELKLHRLELDVFSYNERARKTYLKAGFRQEGVLRDAVMVDGTYADDILMAILEDDWRQLRNDKRYDKRPDSASVN